MKSGDLVASRYAATTCFEVHPKFGLLIRTIASDEICTFICKLSRDDQRRVHPSLGTYTAATMMIMRADCSLVYVDKRMLSKL